MTQYLDASYSKGMWDITLMDTEIGRRFSSSNESLAIAMGNCMDFAATPDGPSSHDWNQMTLLEIKEFLDAKR